MGIEIMIGSSDKTLEEMSIDEKKIYFDGAKVFSKMLPKKFLEHIVEVKPPANVCSYVTDMTINSAIPDVFNAFRLYANDRLIPSLAKNLEMFKSIKDMSNDELSSYISGAEDFSYEVMRNIKSRAYTVSNDTWVYWKDIEKSIADTLETYERRINRMIEQEEIKETSFERKEIIEIYTDSKTLDDIEEIEREVAEIRTYTGYNFDELARYVCNEPCGKNILVELQVSTKDMLDEGMEFISIAVYEFEGELEDFQATNEIVTIDFDGDWANAINTMRTLAIRYSE